ncbi:MAG: hypothetical protein RLZZ04_87 [Cyanobacteriota bacterium]|jgi:hypothetical protein
MALKLVKKYSRKIINQESFLIPLIFKSEYLIILASCQNCRATWHKAGYLSQYVDTLPLKKVQLLDSKLILLNSPIMQSFVLYQVGYQLKFNPVDWLKELTLEIYEPNMSLYQSENVSSNPADFTGQSTPFEFALTAVAVSVLPVNPNRKGLVVRNRGNKVAYLGFAATVTDKNAPYSIPGGTTLEETGDFPPGPLFMIAPAGNTDVVVMEIF